MLTKFNRSFSVNLNEKIIFTVQPKYSTFANLPSSAKYTPPIASSHANDFNSRSTYSNVRPGSRQIHISDASLQRDGPYEECYLDIDRNIYLRYVAYNF